MSLCKQFLFIAYILVIIYECDYIVAKQSYNWNQVQNIQDPGSGGFPPNNRYDVNNGYNFNGRYWTQPSQRENNYPNAYNSNPGSQDSWANNYPNGHNSYPRYWAPVDQENDNRGNFGSGTSPSIDPGSGGSPGYQVNPNKDVGSGNPPPFLPIIPITTPLVTVAPLPKAPTQSPFNPIKPPIDDPDSNSYEGSAKPPFPEGSGASPWNSNHPSNPWNPSFSDPLRPNPQSGLWNPSVDETPRSRIPNIPDQTSEFQYPNKNERIIEFIIVGWQYSEFMAAADRQNAEWKNLERILSTNFRNVLPNGKNYDIELLSLRPGNIQSQVIGEVKLTQLNSDTFDRDILVSLVKIANTGKFGALQIVPQQFDLLTKSCKSNEVRCSSSECRRGKYCDGKMDCSMNNRQDEPITCPKCFGYTVNIAETSVDIEEGSPFKLTCTAPFSCGPLVWEHKSENSAIFRALPYPGIPSLSMIKKKRATPSDSGIYKCGVGVKNTTVVVKVRSAPRLTMYPNLTRFSLVPGTNPFFWCNSSNDARTTWLLPNNTIHVSVRHFSNGATLLNFTRISMNASGKYFCQMTVGQKEQNISLLVTSPCQGADNFLCHDGLNCYTKKQSCDTIRHCRDSSDERNCSLCPANSLMVDKMKVEVNEGESDMVKCIGPSSCLPIKWERVGFSDLPNNVNILGNDLYLTMMNSSLAGVYRCTSGSTYAETKVIVHTEPSLSLIPAITKFNLTYGENRHILCRSDPGHRAQWIFRGAKFWPRGVQRVDQPNTGQQLVFTDASADMAGSYECQLRWGIGYSKMISLSLAVSVKPVECNSSAGERACADHKRCLPSRQFCDGVPQCNDKSDEKNCPKCHNGFVAVDSTRLEIEEGSNGQATCWAPEACQPVSWRRVNSSSLPSNAKQINNKLYFFKVTSEDSGRYECYSGDKFAVLNVTVHTAIRLSLSVPAGVQMFQYGQVNTVSCTSNVGQPRWRRGDGLALTNGGYIAQTNVSVGTTKLHFNYPVFEASGFYECYVKLRADTPETSIQLMVYVQPVQCNPVSEKRCNDRTRCVKVQQWCDGKADCADRSDEADCRKCKDSLYISPPKSSIIESDLLVFTCQVQSEQCLPVSWHRDDGKPFDSNRWINNGQSLILVSALEADSGKIICRHGNRYSSSNLTVLKEEVRLNISVNELRVPAGSNTTVSCLSTTGYPLWASPIDRQVYMYGVRYRQPHKKRMDISFVNVQKLASGHYQCSLRGKHGLLKTVGFKLIVT